MNHVHFKTYSGIGCSAAVWRWGEADFRLWFGTLQGLTVLPWRSSWRTSVPREYNTFKHKTLVGTKALREENSPQGKVTMENETPLLFKAQYGGCAAESRHRGCPGCSTLCVGLLPTLRINSPDFFQPDHVYFCYSIILGKNVLFFFSLLSNRKKNKSPSKTRNMVLGV